MPRIIDVIEVPNQGANELVRRVPEVGSGDFRLGSQVIVRESQRAVFYRDGHSLDVFPPGRHTISTMNLPLLSGLLKLVTGGNDVFTAERGVTPELRVVVLSAGPHAVIVDNPRYGRIERVVDVSAEEGETLAVFDFTR